MRAMVVLVAVVQICSIAPTAWAETQVKAEDCSSAVSGTLIGSHIEVHCLSKEDIARVVDELVRQGLVQRAEDIGLERAFIVSLAARMRPTQKLDFDQAVVEVSHAVDVAMNVVAEGSSGSSDQLVDEVLKRVADKTKANDPAGATREAEEGFARWEKQEAERRTNASAQGVTLLEAALKTDLLRFDAAAAAGRVEKIASLQHENDPEAQFEAAVARYDQFEVEGRDKGVNFSLQVAIAIARREAALTQDPDQHGVALNDLGIALAELGGRDSGTARLEEAVQAYHAALEERTRERVPLDWAMTQNNLGNALAILGERESGTARLEDAVAAYRAALEEYTRERVPLDWAATQYNLGIALGRLGERESGTARLEETVAAFRAALGERTRERAPLDWAFTQWGLGSVLVDIGERESGTAGLDESVAAFHSALNEVTRERVPLQWANLQNDLGGALEALGERESGTARLEAAVAAYRAALEERTRDRVPLDWAQTQNNLGNALQRLGERESGTARLEAAMAAYQAALEEYTRERVPLDWAMTQNNLGSALLALGERESGTARLEEAVVAYNSALKEWTHERVPLDWATAQNNLGGALERLGERESGTARLDEAVQAYSLALEERTRDRVPLDWATSFGNQGVAMMLIADRTNDGAVAGTAEHQIQTAYETERSGGQQPFAAYFQAQLLEAQRVNDRLKGKRGAITSPSGRARRPPPAP